MSVAQLPGSMYPTAIKYPGPAKARILRNHGEPWVILMVRWDSGSDGRVRALRQPEVPAVFRGGCVRSCLEKVSPIFLLTIVNYSSKLYLITSAAVNGPRRR